MNTATDPLDQTICRTRISQLAESVFPAKDLQKKYQGKLNANQFLKLQAFVEETIADNEIPLMPRFSSGRFDTYDRTPLADKYFQLFPDFIRLVKQLSPAYEYSPYITAFIACCECLGLFAEGVNWETLWDNTRQFGIHRINSQAADLFNRLVNELRVYCKSHKVKTKVSKRLAEANERFAEYGAYSDAIFADCASVIVIRIDLSYKPVLADSIDAHQAVDDLDHLLNNMRSNSMFRALKGKIFKLEYGVVKKIHWHAVLYFDASVRHKLGHIHLAQKIGEYWSTVISKNRGDYWNVNSGIEEYRRAGILGIGHIHANDTKLRDRLKNGIIRYLCKADQYIKPKVGPDIKLIRRGKFPKIPKIKPGRKRKKDPNEILNTGIDQTYEETNIVKADLMGQTYVRYRNKTSPC
jgi:hypothetical protein